jgi:hypothetical protein
VLIKQLSSNFRWFEILDGFMTANEALHSVKNSGQNSFVMKIDFHKAFNSVPRGSDVIYGFLEEVDFSNT